MQNVCLEREKSVKSLLRNYDIINFNRDWDILRHDKMPQNSKDTHPCSLWL